MKVGIIQQHNTSDIKDNINRLARKITELAGKGAELIVLQELHNSLYFCQEENVDTFDLAEPIPGPSTDFFGRLAKENNVVIVTSLFERRAAGLYHNTAVVMECDGTIAGKYRKMHIPDDPAYYEKFYFTPGDLGFRPIDTSVGRLGVLVCWDQWYPEAARLMALQGAEVLIYPTAIGYTPNDDNEEQQRQREAWTTVQRGHAVANGLPVIAVNRVGLEVLEEVRVSFEEVRGKKSEVLKEVRGEKLEVRDMQHKGFYCADSDNKNQQDNSLTSHPSPLTSKDSPITSIYFWGSSFVAGPQGEMIYRAPEKEEAMQIVDIDMRHSEQVRRWWPFLRDRRIDMYDGITKRFID